MLLLLLSLFGAIDPEDLLPAEEAFQVDLQLSRQTARLHFDVAEGYYLYRHAFGFETRNPGLVLGEASIPDGERKTDEFFGEVETYRGDFVIELPVRAAPSEGRARLLVALQGCADVGVCYPPEKRELSASIPASTAGPGVGSSTTSMFATGTALPVLQAFAPEVAATGPERALVRFSIQPGYYLYRNQLGFSAPEAEVEIIDLPAAEAFEDPHFGETMIYRDVVEIPLRVSGVGSSASLQIAFQGCQENGICYPPESIVRNVRLIAGPDSDDSAVATAETLGETDALSQRLLMEPNLLTLGLFFLAGIGLALTPCVYPMIPILAGIIIGDAERHGSPRGLFLSIAYVIGMVVVYVLAGIAAASVGASLQAFFQHPAIIGATAALLVALALAMFGVFTLRVPAGWEAQLTRLSQRQSSGTFAGVFAMGALSTLIVGACVAPPLAAVVQFVAQTGDRVYGAAAFGMLALGQGVPLLIVGGLGAALLPRAGTWMDAVKHVFGVLLLGLAIWMLSRVLDETLTLALWGALLVSAGIVWGAFEQVGKGWRQVQRSFAMLTFLWGAAAIIGAAAGGDQLSKPLAPLVAANGSPSEREAELRFTRVESLAELDRVALSAGQPIMLDFYADWCVECKRMEEHTFPDPVVTEQLASFLPVQVDVTDNDREHRDLLERFELIGPPAILFLRPDGSELRSYRLIGYRDAEEFANHLQRVRGALTEV